MKILIVGLGSIGKRHLSTLQSFGNVELAVLRSRSKQKYGSGAFLETHNITDALNFNPDGVIICNPTSLHISASLPYLKKGI